MKHINVAVPVRGAGCIKTRQSVFLEQYPGCCPREGRGLHRSKENEINHQ